MNCSRFSITPMQRRLCFFGGFSSGIGLLTAIILNREMIKEKMITTQKYLTAIKNEPKTSMYIEFGIPSLGVFGGFVCFGTQIYKDVKLINKSENSCCRLIRTGIARSVLVYPMWAVLTGVCGVSALINFEALENYEKHRNSEKL